MIEIWGITPACRKWSVILQNSCGYLMLLIAVDILAVLFFSA